MDVSPVQSGSKCSSDFSIERILSDDSGRKDNGDVPNWLCCTRYQPPRIPRPVNGGGRARRSGRHARVPFTATQAAALEAAFARAPYLAPPALKALAAALQLRDDRIKIWFQNRRARERREKCATISPPSGIALPPTSTTPTSFAQAHAPWKHPKPELHPNPESITSFGNLHNSSSSTPCLLPMFSTNNDHCTSSDEGSPENRSESPLDIETV